MAKLTVSKMVEALYDKFIKNAGGTAMGTPGKPSGGQVEPVLDAPKPEVWNLYLPADPEEQKKFPVIDCPPGWHRLFDWANYQVKIQKDCGTV